MKPDTDNISTLRAEFNGSTHEFKAGISILEAARELGINVPTLCHDARLKPCGACRMCLVEVKGSSQLVASCMNKLRDGMKIETHSVKTEESRKMDLRMLARKYPREEFLKFSDKPFHRLARRYGLGKEDFTPENTGKTTDDSHAYIKVDMARCIDCFACVRICDELQGQFVWQIGSRGTDTRIIWDRGASFAESSCVSCGACADVCPTGALEDKSVLENGFPAKWTKTVCPYCGTGCEIEVGVQADKIVQIKPAMDSPVNHGHLCVKGRYAHQFVDSGDRVTAPMIRRKDEWVEVSWAEAIDFAAREMKRIAGKYGSEAIAVLGSARAF